MHSSTRSSILLSATLLLLLLSSGRLKAELIRSGLLPLITLIPACTNASICDPKVATDRGGTGTTSCPGLREGGLRSRRTSIMPWR